MLTAIWYDIFLVTIRATGECVELSVGAGFLLALVPTVYVVARHLGRKDRNHIPVARCVPDRRTDPTNARGIARAARANK